MLLCYIFHLWWYFQTFSELIEAASKGDQRSVDQFTNDMKCTDSVAGEDNAYTMFIEDMQTEPVLAFCFGKAVGSEIGICTKLQSAFTIDYTAFQ